MSMRLTDETVLNPYYKIYLGGVKLGAQYKQYITNVEVDESDTEASVGRVTVSDIDHIFLNMAGLTKKMPIKIYMGFQKKYRKMLDGEVTHIEADFGEDGTPVIVIGALDNRHKMTHTKKSRKWKNKKASDVAKVVAKEYGFNIKIQESKYKIDEITQEDETDATLLARLADDEGFIFFYTSHDNTLYFGERFSGLNMLDVLYYNCGDHTVMSFQPTLVEKNKATNVSESDSSVSDDTGNTVDSKTDGGSDSDNSSGSSQAGGDTKYGISTVTGQVALNKSYKQLESLNYYNMDDDSKAHVEEV